MKKRIRMFFIIMVVFLAGGMASQFIFNSSFEVGFLSERNENLKLENNDKKRDVKKLNIEPGTGYGYKLIYGKWIATEEIGRIQGRINSLDASDVLGKEFEFYDWRSEYSYDGEKVYVSYPYYKFTIVPFDKNDPYFRGMPNLTNFGVEGKYLTIFSVYNEKVGSNNILYIIKDDETIIMYYKDSYIELKRIEHASGYETWRHAV